MTIATKANPRLWETAKKKACTSGGLCKHSARKMQWATTYYKKHGGKYIGKKQSSNTLVRWGKQKWRTSSGKKSNGKLRYLPSKAWKKLSASERRRTNNSKQRGYRRGNQYVRQPLDIAKKTRRYRDSRTRRSKSKKKKMTTQSSKSKRNDSKKGRRTMKRTKRRRR